MYFYKNWEEYASGFGNPKKEYWIDAEVKLRSEMHEHSKEQLKGNERKAGLYDLLLDELLFKKVVHQKRKKELSCALHQLK
ncbi:hypothetical protein HPB48_022138 [Haemaphysalis longicornis]|uniref:Fibrinogen C-terminal domain-containing protein n=1 Tax=Haemaphysalis longicornis TaxID=44386 RepID=A0A9J6GY60_HAELO|nr:hypothetical protein HPB48_022138 [Haemaphysalis longicornis]